MSLNLTKTKILYYGLIACLLGSCAVRPPYNNFKPLHHNPRKVVTGAVMGAAVGGATSGTLPGALTGAVVGGTIGLISTYTNPKGNLIKDLKKCDIQFVQYGDTMTLIIPTDKYFMFASPRLNEVRYAGLLHVITLLRRYPESIIYVAGFTDNVGTRSHKNKLSQAQAESMLTYLWANGIQAQRLKAEGYGEKNTVGDNALIHGSAFNRRIELQWFSNKPPKCCIAKTNPAITNFAMK